MLLWSSRRTSEPELPERWAAISRKLTVTRKCIGLPFLSIHRVRSIAIYYVFKFTRTLAIWWKTFGWKW
ncbi:hypothetical protein Q1695_013338 [Nippostrongylus brasiliensis]|nr:hypothetical protein Q1695_013338 [Nippostrongylus brasiliensis]